MFRLVDPDLPAEPPPPRQSAAVLRVYRDPAHRLAPFAQIGLQNKYQSSGFEPIAETLPDPDFLGKLFRLEAGFEISSVVSLSAVGTLEQQPSPVSIRPGQFWTDKSAINLYADQVNEVLAELETSTLTPIPDSDFNFTLSLDRESIAVLSASSEGLSFNPALNSAQPETGEFVQTEKQLKLYGSQVFLPRTASKLIIRGLRLFEGLTPVCAIASFDLTSTGIEYVDSVDYLGMAFSPAQATANPQVGEFFWEFPVLTLFIPFELAIALRVKSKPVLPHTSAVGTLTYTSYRG